jgi:hypothetical protein
MVLPLRLIQRAAAAAAARLPVAASFSPSPVLRRAQSPPGLVMVAAYSAGSAAGRRLLFRQLFEKESSTYTYLLADVADPDKPAVVSLSVHCFRFGFFRLIWLLQCNRTVLGDSIWWECGVGCAANGGSNVPVHSNLRVILS